jgi:hypothetical protein
MQRVSEEEKRKRILLLAVAALLGVRHAQHRIDPSAYVGPTSARTLAPSDEDAQFDYDVRNAGPGRGFGSHPSNVPRRIREDAVTKYTTLPFKIQDFINFQYGPFMDLVAIVEARLPRQDMDVTPANMVFFVLYRLKIGAALTFCCAIIGVCNSTGSKYWTEVMAILYDVAIEELAPLPGFAEYLMTFMPDTLKATGAIDGMALGIQEPIKDSLDSYSKLRHGSVMQVQDMCYVDGTTCFVAGTCRGGVVRKSMWR